MMTIPKMIIMHEVSFSYLITLNDSNLNSTTSLPLGLGNELVDTILSLLDEIGIDRSMMNTKTMTTMSTTSITMIAASSTNTREG